MEWIFGEHDAGTSAPFSNPGYAAWPTMTPSAPAREPRERRDVRHHEVHVVGVHDRQLSVRVHGAAPEAREVLHARREAGAREAVQEHHPADHDVLRVEPEAAALEDDGPEARLREVEARARSPRRSRGAARRGP